MNLVCLHNTLKAHGYVEADAPPPVDEFGLIAQLEATGKLSILELDPECIDSERSYMDLLVKIKRFMGEALVLRRIQSSLNEEGDMSVRFELNEQPHEWTFPQADGWVSGEFMQNLYALVAEYTPGRLVTLPCPDAWVYMVYVPVEVEEDLLECGEPLLA